MSCSFESATIVGNKATGGMLWRGASKPLQQRHADDADGTCRLRHFAYHNMCVQSTIGTPHANTAAIITYVFLYRAFGVPLSQSLMEPVLMQLRCAKCITGPLLIFCPCASTACNSRSNWSCAQAAVLRPGAVTFA